MNKESQRSVLIILVLIVSTIMTFPNNCKFFMFKSKIRSSIVLLIVLLQLSSCSILKNTRTNYSEKVNGIAIEMIFVEGGLFSMGCSHGQDNCNKDELPVHQVRLNNFHIGKYEVTFEQYDSFCNDTGYKKPDDNDWGRDNRPVINVNLEDALAFCEWLSKKSGKNYRLPTEAEWEYAAKGGNKSEDYLFSGSNKPNKVAWFSIDSCDERDFPKILSKTHPVGGKRSNELNIHDMSGNVWEWCSDGYDRFFYGKSPVDNPKKTISILCVARGGSWYTNEIFSLTSNRDSEHIKKRDNDLGFRIVFSL